jgi:hypothetical protein
MHPQPRMQNKKAYEHSHHRFTGITRHSPRNGVTTYNVISPVIGLCCHRRRRDTSRRLERQRRGVRTTRLRRPRNARLVERAFASIASRPAFVTIASRPSLGRDQIALLLFLAERQAILRIFRNLPVPDLAVGPGETKAGPFALEGRAELALSYPSHFCGVETSEDGERELPAKAKPLT